MSIDFILIPISIVGILWLLNPNLRFLKRKKAKWNLIIRKIIFHRIELHLSNIKIFWIQLAKINPLVAFQ